MAVPVECGVPCVFNLGVDSKADVDDSISTREGEAAVLTDFDLGKLGEDDKLAATGLDPESLELDKTVVTAEEAGEFSNPDVEAPIVSLTVAGGAEDGSGSASGDGSITTTVVVV